MNGSVGAITFGTDSGAPGIQDILVGSSARRSMYGFVHLAAFPLLSEAGVSRLLVIRESHCDDLCPVAPMRCLRFKGMDFPSE